MSGTANSLLRPKPRAREVSSCAGLRYLRSHHHEGETAHAFQINFDLNSFWGEQGCIIQQPYDMEKGAGTFNPATFLRSLDRSLERGLRGAVAAADRRRYGENPTACSTIISIR